MDLEHAQQDESQAAEQDVDAWNPWNLPRAAPIPTPSLDEWPERETRFEDGFARMEGKPAA